ncbi:hypothetical protein [Micromonospora sediminicola]|uniref:hypothetical protein n=1 Tax=Micromonospora sediminicola TaxID=946078 RepID=UPI000A85F685|nr:hypothetical protein [Micromonospora sediminicola]
MPAPHLPVVVGQVEEALDPVLFREPSHRLVTAAEPGDPDHADQAGGVPLHRGDLAGHRAAPGAQAAQNHDTASLPASRYGPEVPPSIVPAVRESACGTTASFVPPPAVGAMVAAGVGRAAALGPAVVLAEPAGGACRRRRRGWPW